MRCLLFSLLFLSFHAKGQQLDANIRHDVVEAYFQQLLPVDFTLPVPLPFHLKGIYPVESTSDFLFYVHMPKTAGQAFHRIIARSLKGCQLNDLKCNPFKSNNSESLPVAPRLDLTYAPKYSDANLMTNRSAMVPRFAQFAAGLGHADVSLATQLPQRRVIFMTMLREPVARLSSMYNYMIGNTNVALECVDAVNRNLIYYPNITTKGISADKKLSLICNEPMIRRRVFKNVSLPSYLATVRTRFERGLKLHTNSSPYIMGPTCLPPRTTFTHFLEALKRADYDNYMTRAVTGQTSRSFLDPSRPQLKSAEELVLAKEMLAAFPFVGLTERFEDSVELYLWTFGFPYSSAGKEFIFNKSKRKNTFSQEDEVRIRQMEFQDMELYKFGMELFEQRFQMMRQAKRSPPGV
jgi:hypothetical protein